MDKNIKTYIAVGVALLIFVPFIFRSQLFSRIFPFSALQAGFFSGTTTTGGGSAAVPLDGVPSRDTSANSGGFAGLSDPVTILDLEVGEGMLAEESKKVHVGYIGTRIHPETNEEIIFDQNLSRENPLSFVIGSGMVIPGFDAGVAGMRVGGKRLVIIKPEMGYGDQQVGDIPPNTTLQFMIELYEVTE